MHVEFSRTETITPPGGPGIIFRQLGRGEPMFVFHGGSGSFRHWIANIEALAEHFAVWVPDLPGFGDSGDVSNDIALDPYIGLMVAAVEQIAAAGEKLRIVGFSFGGMVGAGVAARLQPRMHSLTLLAPGGMGKPAGLGPAVKLLKVEKGMDEEAIRATHRANLGMMMIYDTSRISEDTVTLHRGSIERARFRNWGLSWTNSVVGYLAEMAFPAQFLIGENDAVARPTPENRIERCRAAKPDLEVHVIAGAGHWAQYECPDVVNGHLIRFHGG